MTIVKKPQDVFWDGYHVYFFNLDDTIGKWLGDQILNLMKMDYYNFSKYILICKIDKNFINVRRSKSSKLILLFLF